ncbi:MAG: hypothetical protein WAU70_04535 [Flavobacteriales bacterium]
MTLFDGLMEAEVRAAPIRYRGKLVVIALMGLTMHKTLAQDSTMIAIADGMQSSHRDRFGLWYTPTRVDRIHGIAIGITSAGFRQAGPLLMNGLDIELNPIVMIGAPFVIVDAIRSPFLIGDSAALNNPDDSPASDSAYPKAGEDEVAKVNGIGIGTMYVGSVNGVMVSGVLSRGGTYNGVSVCAGSHILFRQRGLLVAGLYNKVRRGAGIQIALFNYAVEHKGVQIGLINKIGRRTLPFINIGF